MFLVITGNHVLGYGAVSKNACRHYVRFKRPEPISLRRRFVSQKNGLLKHTALKTLKPRRIRHLLNSLRIKVTHIQRLPSVQSL
jgi:hypothetical protein